MQKFWNTKPCHSALFIGDTLGILGILCIRTFIEKGEENLWSLYIQKQDEI